MASHRVLFAIGLSAFIVAPVSVAHATPTTVFSESFENCYQGEGPTLSDVNTALDTPITVDLWWNVVTDCPGWDLSAGAWLARHVSGPEFPDGEFALWLNEYPQGVAAVSLGGLTMDAEYTIEFDAWTDNDPADTSLEFEYVTAGAIPSIVFELPGGSGPTHFSQTFVTDVEDTVLFFYGSTSNDASPIIDNIVVTTTADGSNESLISDNSLAQTGFTSDSLAIAAAAFIMSGIGLAFRRNRARQ